MKKTKRKFTPQEKVKILRLHLMEHKPVSDNRRNLMRTGKWICAEQVFFRPFAGK